MTLRDQGKAAGAAGGSEGRSEDQGANSIDGRTTTAAPASNDSPPAGGPIDVVVGILLQPNGDVLLGQRPAGKPYAGYWEFPGGKVEPGEALFAALQREFIEELGLTIDSAEQWCGVEHVYEHAHVRLHFFISRAWRGRPQSLEGQAFAWQGAVGVAPLLPATIPLLDWLDQLRYPERPATPPVPSATPVAPSTAQ